MLSAAGEGWNRSRERTAPEVSLENLPEDSPPAFRLAQLLRSSHKPAEKEARTGEFRLNFRATGVGQIHAQAVLAGVTGLPRHATKRSAGRLVTASR